MVTTRNFTANASRESIVAKREINTMTGHLGMYVGRVDGIQLRANEMLDRLGGLGIEVWDQSTLIKMDQANLQFDMMR